MRPSNRYGFLSVITTAALAAFTLPAAAQEVFEQGIYEIAIAAQQDRVTTRVLLAPSGKVLIPVTQTMLLTGIPNQRRPQQWHFDWPPPSFSVDIDLTTGRYTRGDERGQLAPESWRFENDELFVDSMAIAALLGAVMRTNNVDVLITLAFEGGFPAERKLNDEARRAARLRSSARPGGLGYVPYPSTTGGFALNWDASFVTGGAVTHGVVRGILGASVLGGEVAVGSDIGIGIDLQGTDRLARYVRPFPNNPWIQQATIGSLVTPTPVPRYMNGVFVSNAPMIRPNDFQEVVYQPTLPPGWTAEVYEGESLIGVSDGSTAGAVPLPVGYGFTPVHVRILGPAGQERTEQVQYIVPSSRLPARHFEYNVGVGECRANDCGRYGFADVSRGLTAFITAGLGASVIKSDSASAFRPYARLSVSPRPNISLEAQGEGKSHVHAALQYIGARNTSLNGSISWFNPSDNTLNLSGTYADMSAAVYLWDRYLTTTVQGHFDARERLTDAQVFLGMPLRFGFLGAQWNRTLDSPDLFGARAFWSPRLKSWISRAATLSSTLSFSRERFELAEITGNMQIRRTSYLNAALQWQGGGRGPSMAVTYTIRSPFGTGQSRIIAARHNTSMVLGMNGGLALSPSGDITSIYSGAVGKAGIAGVTFLDTNGNGVRDAAEPVLPGVPLLFEGQRTVSNDEGRFITWDLPAVRATRFSVDSLHLEDIRLTPLRAEYAVRLPANVFSHVDVALIRTREVAGRVEAANRTNLGGITIELHSADGGIVLQTRTFSDGEFYFPRVPPGTYTAAIAAASLGALSATSQPASQPVDIPFTPGGVIRLSSFNLAPIR